MYIIINQPTLSALSSTIRSARLVDLVFDLPIVPTCWLCLVLEHPSSGVYYLSRRSISFKTNRLIRRSNRPTCIQLVDSTVDFFLNFNCRLLFRLGMSDFSHKTDKFLIILHSFIHSLILPKSTTITPRLSLLLPPLLQELLLISWVPPQLAFARGTSARWGGVADGDIGDVDGDALLLSRDSAHIAAWRWWGEGFWYWYWYWYWYWWSLGAMS